MDERNLDADPIVQFRAWFDEAVTEGVREPDAMTVATAGSTGAPSARTVSLRGLDERGFAFYTNYRSPKARDLDENPRAAIVFHWREVERQVRAAGTVARLSREESLAYWRNRPLGSRLSALISPQSEVVADRAKLELAYDEAAARYGDDPPLPEFWGGYVVTPVEVELWQGRPNRLHDRVRYRHVDGGWIRERLAP
ncbi:MAG TPA: pyridoxamine 5'-phosphate oxidase [Acidimicrobiia bacterium]|nr:pyridoxamine 5'-phosphate oxidase [Acidimicrobiia bacterium]